MLLHHVPKRTCSIKHKVKDKYCFKVKHKYYALDMSSWSYYSTHAYICILLLTVFVFCYYQNWDNNYFLQIVSQLSQNDHFKIANSLENNTSNHKDVRTAICLVGGSRAFELTGPTIKQHVLDEYRDADIFLNVPLDKDTYKLFLLGDNSRFATAQIFTPQKLDEDWISKAVLTPSNSPNGIQGLLQYFNLVEGCWKMITQYEKKHNFQYNFVIRTRLDGYWSGSLKSINEEVKPGYYYIPYGSRFGGLNDRFGIGDRSTSEIALTRLSSIQKLHSKGYRGLNSERAFKAQLDIAKIGFKFLELPFCVLSSRKYGWPPYNWGVPVASISSKGTLNGAKCRPCEPQATGEKASQIANSLIRDWSWIGPEQNIDFCDPRNDWDPHWDDIFDRLVGVDQASIRKNVNNQTLNECIERFEKFQNQWEMWESPSALTICEKHFK